MSIYKTNLEYDVADTEVPLESVNLLPELLAHVGHVGPLAGLGEEQQEAELGGPEQPGEAHPVTLVNTLMTDCRHRALATRDIEGAGQPVQLVTLQGEVSFGGQEGPPRLLRGLRVEVELDTEVPVLPLHHLHHRADPGLPGVPGGLGLVTRWHGQWSLSLGTDCFKWDDGLMFKCPVFLQSVG